jgi:hypothetical protein
VYTDIIVVTLTQTTYVETSTSTAWGTIAMASITTSTIVQPATTTRVVTSGVPAQKRSFHHVRAENEHTPVETTTAVEPSGDVGSVESSAAASVASELPTPTRCANLEEFSSACSCITAVNDATPTSTVTVTVSSVITSTSTAVETVHRTTTVRVYSNVTRFKTTSTKTSTTTSTATVTTTVAPTSVGKWQIASPQKHAGKQLYRNAAGQMSFKASSTTKIGLRRSGGQPYDASQTQWKMFVENVTPTTTLVSVKWRTSPKTNDVKLNCRVESINTIKCDSPRQGSSVQWWICSDMYFMATLDGKNPPLGCDKITLKVV